MTGNRKNRHVDYPRCVRLTPEKCRGFEARRASLRDGPAPALQRRRLASGTLPADGRPNARAVESEEGGSVSAKHHLSNTALIDDRADVTLHALAQVDGQLVVEYELAVRVGDLVGRQRPEALRRRHVGARREGAEPALLLL